MVWIWVWADFFDNSGKVGLVFGIIIFEIFLRFFMPSVLQLRKFKFYRFLEGFLAISSLSFLFLAVILAWISPTTFSICLIIYSFLWLLKFSLNVFYTIFSFKQNRRWQTFDFQPFFEQNSQNLEQKTQVLENLSKFSQKYQKQIGWQEKIQQDIQVLQQNVENESKFWPNNVFHLPIFAVYNEPSEVLLRSLRKILENNYDLNKIIVVISQEARVGSEFNEQIRQEISQQNWILAKFAEKIKPKIELEKTTNEIENETAEPNLNPENFELKITNLSENLSEQTNLEKNIILENLAKSEEEISQTEHFLNTENERNQDKLQVFFCEHPDGLVGEIKGKASNEDWGARIGAKILEDLEVDKDLVLVTSLDADSYLKRDFFRHLSYRFCASPDRHSSAFQPVHNYNHNFFEIGFWPRLVATQTTFYNLTNLALEDQITTFAIYSVPLVVLEKVDFWVREVIAEDSLVFLKSLVTFGGYFQVIPHYGQMEADSVQHHDYLEEIISQYRQLQRWAWGGVEGFPYLFWQFFETDSGRRIDLRIRLKWLYLLYSNHFFWATTPLAFGIGPFLPNFIHGNSFMATATSQNLSLFSQYFAWISYIFTFVFGYLTVVFIAYKDQSVEQKKEKSTKKILGWEQIWAILVQIMISPFIYFLMAIPALDAQIRGLLGNYLGYWVTPKK